MSRHKDPVQYVVYGRLVTGMYNSMSCYQSGNDQPHVHTIDGKIVLLKVGDWIIPEPDGNHYRIEAEPSDDTFAWP